jgi:hypothetical protein
MRGRAKMLRERLAIVRERMRYLGIDCLALVPGTNLKYLTNVDFFNSSDL